MFYLTETEQFLKNKQFNIIVLNNIKVNNKELFSHIDYKCVYTIILFNTSFADITKKIIDSVNEGQLLFSLKRDQ